ncbi:MAG: DUF2877 domain-containing protein [Clostridiaceae bacterium]
MQATAVCQRLFTLSQGSQRSGTVHSVFDHAVNLELGEDCLIGLIAETKALTPYAVSVRTNNSFAQAGVRAGMAAYLQNGMLSIPEAGVEVDLSRAARADLSVDSIALGNHLVALALLEKRISKALSGVDAEMSLAALVTGAEGNVFTRFLSPRLEQLFSAISREAFDEATQAAANCAGCGMGLTPSSDDLLCGYFTTLHLLFRANERFDAKAHILDLAQAAANKTNRISGSFLLQSGMALANLAICDLFSSSLPCIELESADRAIARVLAIGSTSGADLLTGTALALRQHIGGNEV